MILPDNHHVSVVLCFYNEQEFLHEAVNSVMKQDHACWELILVDDGSTDGSTAIAKAYASDYPDRIQYVHHPGHCNEGLSASRNLGIEKAAGELIAFLDADDVWLPGKLSHQVNIFRKHPEISVALESSLYWSSWADPGKPDVIVPVGVAEGRYDPPALTLNLYPLGKGAAPCPSGIMARRAVFEHSQFEETFRGIYQMYEDQAFLCKVYLREKIYVSSACHNKYRQRRNSIVSTVTQGGKYHAVRSYYLQWFTQYMKRHRITHKKVKTLLSRARMIYVNPVRYRIWVDVPALTKAFVAKMLVKLGLLSYSKT